MGGIGAAGYQFTGAHWNVTYNSAFEGESAVEGTYECASTAQPPGLFQMHVACTMTQSDGSFTSAWSCNALNKAGTEMVCVSDLHGRTGRFEDPRGGATSHVVSEKSDGVGQFFKPGE